MQEKSTIVVINDKKELLQTICSTLCSSDFVIHAFEYPDEALRFFQEDKPCNLIITDLYMSGIDGFRLCRTLKTQEYKTYNHIPIIVVSSVFPEPDLIALTPELGIKDFVSYPFENNFLKDKINLVLNNKNYQNSKKVLLVEDSESQTKIMNKIFTTNNFIFFNALDGKSALEIFNNENPDIIIVDYHLPDTDGMQLLDQFIKKQPDSIYICITANPTPSLAVSILKKGAQAYIKKPFDPEYILELCYKNLREKTLFKIGKVLQNHVNDLSKSEFRFRQLFNNVPEIITIHNLKGDILHANKYAADVLGYSIFNLCGSNINLIIDNLKCDEFLFQLRQASEHGESKFETTFVNSDQTPIYAEVCVVPVEIDHQQALLSVAHDITEKRYLEKDLELSRKKNEHTSRMATLGEMAGGIAHEINTPLSTIISNISYLIEDVKSSNFNPTMSLKMLEMINTTSYRIASIVKSLKEFAHGGGSHPLEEVAIGRLVKDISNLSTERIKKENIDLKINNKLGDDCVIRCRPVEIVQVILILLNNSCDALSLQESKKIILNIEDTDSDIIFSVIDNGTGIPDDVKNKIMEPFFTTKEIGKGTGLGLSIADSIARTHYGKLFLDEDQKDTCFTLKFPKLIKQQTKEVYHDASI